MSFKEYTVRVFDSGEKSWHFNDELHREDGPAIESENGNRFWYLNGRLHREDGPAAEYFRGTKEWHLNGKLHREDGPAVEYADGHKEWWINGKKLTEQEFNHRLQKKTCDGKIVEIDGVKYQLKVLR